MADSLYFRVRELELELQNLKKELASMLDHPESSVYPKWKAIVTCPQHISLSLLNRRLYVKKKGQVVGTISLAEVDDGAV